MKVTWGELLHFSIALAIGIAVWVGWSDLEPKARLLGAMLLGFGTPWVLMKLYVRLRYGKGAKVTWEP